jgi:hypothetical protein
MTGRTAAAGWLKRAIRAGRLVIFPFAHNELRNVVGGLSIASESALTLEGRSARSVVSGAQKAFFFFFLAATTPVLSSQRKTVESSERDIALIKDS